MDTNKDRITSFIEHRKQLKSKLIYEKSSMDKLKDRVSKLSEERVKLVKAQGVVDKVTQIVSARGVGKIESIVSNGLKLVFGKKVSFIIEKKEGTKGTNYKFLIKDGEVIGSPTESFGGGIVNVTSFLLRIIMIKRFKLAKFMAIDESFNNVSVEYLDKVSSLVKTLTDSHGYTILAVTHQKVLASNADRVYEVYKDGDDNPALRVLDSVMDESALNES